MSMHRPVLMVLGGAEKSLPLVRKARSMGDHVLLCDQGENPPCRLEASEFAHISTTDLPGLRDLLNRRRVDGIVSFGSDLMAIIAAQLADEFDLPGNPTESVQSLVQKDRFRQFLSEHGFPAPRSVAASTVPELAGLSNRLKLPVIVKPSDGAGSTAVARLDDWRLLPAYFTAAQAASRERRVVIEEFLERDHPHMIGGDIFVDRGKVVFWGLLNSHRAIPGLPFLPTGTSYPLEISSSRLAEVKTLLQDLVASLGIRFGGLNVEVLYATDGQPYVIELAPRNGGNRIPELLQMATGFDLFGALVDASLGRRIQNHPSGSQSRVMANYMLHSLRAGRFHSLSIDEKLRPFIRKTTLDVVRGDPVRPFERAPDAIGTIFFEFEDRTIQQVALADLPQLIKVELEQAA